MKRFWYLVLWYLALPALSTAQDAVDEERPSGSLATPSDALFTYSYYMQTEHYNPYKAGKVFYRRIKGRKTDNAFGEWDKAADRAGEDETKASEALRQAADLAVKLKQILDGKGIRLRLSPVPEDSSYRDSITKKHHYLPFPIQLPDLYLERARLDNGQHIWRFGSEAAESIPRLHRQVFPLGSDRLLTLLPKFGETKILGLAVWQYITLVVVGVLSFLVYLIVSWLLGIVISFVANSRLGRDHFDPATVQRIAKTLGYMSVSYVVYVFIPIFQFPVDLSYYIIVPLRLFTTLCILLLGIRIIDLVYSYFEYVVSKTESRKDDQLLVLVVRILKSMVWIAGFVHIMSIFEVNVTALIAGLSIGGLAIALAAQETVKNLIGSAMIHADKPFQVGDLVRIDGDLEGTVIDVGFRSTRIRALDTSIVNIPNGGLADKTIVNLGSREMRRMRTTIGIPYHTPPDLIEAFLLGIRRLHDEHPKTHKQEYYIRLNNFEANALSILLIVYFETRLYVEEVAYREEFMLGILQLAHALGIRVSMPSSAVFIDAMPEKPSNLPDYDNIAPLSEQRSQALLERLRSEWSRRYPSVQEEADKTKDSESKPPLNG